MKPEYDFGKAERGKFYRAGAELRLPVYLDVEVGRVLAERAENKGVSLDELVNGLLKREIKTIESAK